MAAGATRKEQPQAVVWDQQAILRRITKLEDALTALTHSTTVPSSDDSGVVTRNVRDHELLEGLGLIHEVLERIHRQLSFITDVNLEPGES